MVYNIWADQLYVKQAFTHFIEIVLEIQIVITDIKKSFSKVINKILLILRILNNIEDFRYELQT